MQTHTVEILVTVAQDGDTTFVGEYVLRAFAADGKLLLEAREEVTDLDVTISDYARLLTLSAALERLHGKLNGGTAGYALRVVQSSKNVDGWLDKGWKRNAERVKALAGAVETLLMPFSHREFVKVPREALEASLKSGKGVMLLA